MDGTVVRHRERGAALNGDSQIAEPRQDLHRAYLDGLAGGHLDGAERPGLEGGAATGDGRHRKCCQWGEPT